MVPAVSSRLQAAFLALMRVEPRAALALGLVALPQLVETLLVTCCLLVRTTATPRMQCDARSARDHLLTHARALPTSASAFPGDLRGPGLPRAGGQAPGNLMGPEHPMFRGRPDSGLPPGSLPGAPMPADVPPGARFDPWGPGVPYPEHGPNMPDSDMLQPPDATGLDPVQRAAMARRARQRGQSPAFSPGSGGPSGRDLGPFS